VGRRSGVRLSLSAPGGGPEVARAYRPRVPGLSSVGPRRPGTEHTVERPCDA